ncbi:DUF1657 domain-containing protein [Virgibacillus halophilus]|uniref:DUF1657 domain-containing protein n=1 Tax=Tigheibacillus halophilus TaxID=361280 RepID=A0ABU5CC35_9BACI|nr:DUF1657 domain-containing protein [Virgibacillus halophilus]
MTVGSDLKACLASMKSIEASLEMLAGQTVNQSSKQAFHDAHEIVKQMKNDFSKQVIKISNEEPQY